MSEHNKVICQYGSDEEIRILGTCIGAHEYTTEPYGIVKRWYVYDMGEVGDVEHLIFLHSIDLNNRGEEYYMSIELYSDPWEMFADLKEEHPKREVEALASAMGFDE